MSNNTRVNSLFQGVRLADILGPEHNSLGVMRFALATLVLISHSYMYAFGTSEAEPLHGWLGRSLGACAVQMFFILSGLLVAQSFERSASVLDFAAARGLRIFPALMVCVVLTTFVLGPMVTTLPESAYFTDPGTIGYVARTLSLSTGSAPLPGVFETIPYAGIVNSSLWTLKYEVICYAALCFAGVAGLFNPRWRVAFSAVVAVFVAAVFLGAPREVAAYTFLDNLRYFAVFFGTGVLAYLMRDRLVLSGAVLVPLFGAFVLAVDTPFQEVVSAVFLGYGALWAATKTFGPMRAFCNRIDTSFGIYIYAGPVQQTLLYLLPSLTPALLTLMSFAIVFPLALLSWVLIERPALGLRRRFRILTDRLACRGVFTTSAAKTESA